MLEATAGLEALSNKPRPIPLLRDDRRPVLEARTSALARVLLLLLPVVPETTGAS
jgi:hypothetical protein